MQERPRDWWLPAALVVALIVMMGYAIHADLERMQPAAAAGISAEQSTADATWYLAHITIALVAVAMVQAGLFFWQLHYMRQSLRDTKATAEAAREAAIAGTAQAEAVLRSERPWVVISGAKVTWRDSHTSPQNRQLPRIPGSNRILNDWVITLHLKNVGRMPALIDSIVFKIEDASTLPVQPDYSTNAGSLTSQRTFTNGEEGDAGTVGPAPGRIGQLTFYGRITYRELSGAEHHTGFALDVAPYMSAYILHHPHDDNYDYHD